MNHLDNKFYTPELEEFHVGFRYEGRYAKYANINFDEGKCTVGEWSEWTPTQYGNLDWNLYTEQRVKYLDREDIEELGWLYDGRTTELWFTIPDTFVQPFNLLYRAFKLSYNINDNRCMIIGYEWATYKDSNEGETLFFGRIKNYNELKTLMKQIEIIKHG